MESRRADEGLSAVSRVVQGLLLLMCMVGSAGCCFGLQESAVISGTVRDVHGVPQAGTLVQLLRNDESAAGSAVSDLHGRYIMAAIAPGLYRIRATASFFVPLAKSDVRLRAGVQSVVNLTMVGLIEANNWLPAQRRKGNEPVDDWKWTLRSTANRPLLRLVDPEDGGPTSSSASTPDHVTSQGRVFLMNGDGSFGDGGVHQALMLDRTMEDGDGAVLRADIGEDTDGYATAPSADVFAGYERRSAMGGSTRLVVGLQAHPELTNGRSTDGFQVLSLATTQQFALGDTFLIDVGALLEAERLSGTRVGTEPFLRLMVRPNDNLVLEYRYASGRALQSSEDLDGPQPVLTAVIDGTGRPLLDRGMHQELSVSRKFRETVATASGYVDRFPYSAVGGSGVLDATSLREANVIADTTTETFEVAAPGYAAHGAGVSLMQALTPALSAFAEYDRGVALRRVGGLELNHLQDGVQPQVAQAVTVALRGRVARSNTWMRLEYRWQDRSTLSQVNAYNAVPQEAYMTFYVRQRLWCGHLLPDGVDGFVLATNLFKQGYLPVQAPNGKMLVLAQAPQVIQGGLSFNF